MQRITEEHKDAAAAAAAASCDPAVDVGFACLVVDRGRRQQRRKDGGMTYLSDVLPPVMTTGCDDADDTEGLLWERNDGLLGRYWSAGDGFGGDHLPGGSNGGVGDRALTYGEVTPLGVRQLARAMGISGCGDNGNGGDTTAKRDVHFVDLGSGTGKIVAQMYLDQPHRVAGATGIELDGDRHSIGTAALENLLRSEPDILGPDRTPAAPTHDAEAEAAALLITEEEEAAPPVVRLVRGNLLDTELDPATTHVFLSSLCFPEEVLGAIQERLLRNDSVPNLRVVAALNRLDAMTRTTATTATTKDKNENETDDQTNNDGGGGGQRWEERSVPIQTSWGDALARIYHRRY